MLLFQNDQGLHACSLLGLLTYFVCNLGYAVLSLKGSIILLKVKTNYDTTEYMYTENVYKYTYE